MTYHYSDYLRCLERVPKEKPAVYCSWQTNKDGSITISPNDAADLFGSQVIMDMSLIIDADKYRYRKLEKNDEGGEE